MTRSPRSRAASLYRYKSSSVLITLEKQILDLRKKPAID
jgi:hypothetical protein